MIGLAQQVGEVEHLHGQLLRVPRDAPAVLDRPRHGDAVERPKLVRAGHGGDNPRVQQIRVRIARHVVLEIGDYLEQPAELGIVSVQQIVDDPLADEHHFQVERNRLGLQGHVARGELNLSGPAGSVRSRLRALGKSLLENLWVRTNQQGGVAAQRTTAPRPNWNRGSRISNTQWEFR